MKVESSSSAQSAAPVASQSSKAKTDQLKSEQAKVDTQKADAMKVAEEARKKAENDPIAQQMKKVQTVDVTA